MKISNKKLHSRHHHLTKELPEKLYGQLDEVHNFIEINIEYIWDITKNEDKFIKEFASTYAHELLHILVADIMHSLFDVGEEKAIRKMLHEEWGKELKEYYEEREKNH